MRLTKEELQYLTINSFRFIDKKKINRSNAGRYVYAAEHDPSYLINVAYDYYNGDVPHFDSKPDPKDYGLSSDILKLEDETVKSEEKKRDQVRNISRIIIMLIFGIIIFCYGMRCGFEYKRAGSSMNIWWLLVPSYFISEFFSYLISKTVKTPIKHSNDQYIADMLAFNYWQQLQDKTYWESLDGHQFEDAVASLYRKQGYHAVVSKAGGDGGIDIVLTKDNRRIAVQCKAHNKPVGPAVARDLYGTMTGQGYKEGILVSTHGFTKGVYDFVQDKPISLVTLYDILRMPQDIPTQKSS